MSFQRFKNIALKDATVLVVSVVFVSVTLNILYVNSLYKKVKIIEQRLKVLEWSVNMGDTVRNERLTDASLKRARRLRISFHPSDENRRMLEVLPPERELVQRPYNSMSVTVKDVDRYIHMLRAKYQIPLKNVIREDQDDSTSMENETTEE